MVSGEESDTYVPVTSVLVLAPYLVELVEFILKVILEDFRGGEELSHVAAFAAEVSPHQDCLADDVFIDDVRGGVLEHERLKQARREGKWCRVMGVREPVLRDGAKAAEGAKAVSLDWHRQQWYGSTKLHISIGCERDQDRHEEVWWVCRWKSFCKIKEYNTSSDFKFLAGFFCEKDLLHIMIHVFRKTFCYIFDMNDSHSFTKRKRIQSESVLRIFTMSELWSCIVIRMKMYFFHCE